MNIGRFVILFLLLSLQGFGNFPSDTLRVKKKLTFYGCWGYNREWYTKSNIRLQNNTPTNTSSQSYDASYDFTIYKAKANDRADFEQIPDLANITIPQFGFRAGVFFNDKNNLGIEINYDHAKYVVDDYQKVRIKGQIFGQQVDKDTILDPKTLLHFEHTDGANFWLLMLVKRFNLVQTKNKYFGLEGIIKGGAGIVYPRTDVTIFGNRLNNKWKISGYDIAVEGGVRTVFLKYGFVEFTAKGVFAHYVNALVHGRGNGKASHYFGAGMLIANIGFQFGGLK